jgi:hypothetical protein
MSRMMIVVEFEDKPKHRNQFIDDGTCTALARRVCDRALLSGRSALKTIHPRCFRSAFGVRPTRFHRSREIRVTPQSTAVIHTK